MANTKPVSETPPIEKVIHIAYLCGQAQIEMDRESLANIEPELMDKTIEKLERAVAEHHAKQAAILPRVADIKRLMELKTPIEGNEQDAFTKEHYEALEEKRLALIRRIQPEISPELVGGDGEPSEQDITFPQARMLARMRVKIGANVVLSKTFASALIKKRLAERKELTGKSVAEESTPTTQAHEAVRVQEEHEALSY